MPARALISVALLLGGLCSFPAKANPAICLQAPERVKACPHKLYRAVQLAGMSKPALTCICVTDFALLLATPADATERLAQFRRKQQLTEHLQQDVEPILEILRRAP